MWPAGVNPGRPSEIAPAVRHSAGVLTAHGLIEVALGSGVPVTIGWLYPVITDGLALVAYAATTRLGGAGQKYAWVVVVLAAGLSAVAQAGCDPRLRRGCGPRSGRGRLSRRRSPRTCCS
jgi:hypothetical protein